MDRLGYNVRRQHYYEPLPEFHALDRGKLDKLRVNPTIQYNFEYQIELLRLLAAYREEIVSHCIDGQGLDAGAYYAIIRHCRPKRIIEIGCGYSTRIAHLAIKQNESIFGINCEVICIEPYPESRLLDAKLPFELIQKKVEDTDLSLYDKLESGDILFIDSSHVVRTQGDVVFEFLEILPRLKRGVWVHVHDIFLPMDYPADWVIDKRWAFNEQYLLEAFLSMNDKFCIRLGNYWLSNFHADRVQALLSSNISQSRWHGRTSIWLQKCE